MNISVYKGSGVNKLICIVILCACIIPLIIISYVVFIESTLDITDLLPFYAIFISAEILFYVRYLYYLSKEKKSNSIYAETLKHHIGNELRVDIHEYEIPRDDLLAYEKKILRRPLVTVSFFCAIVFTFIMVGNINSVDDFGDFMKLAGYSLLTVATPVLIVLIVYINRFILYKKHVPYKVIVKHDKIYIDDMCFSRNNVSEIYMSALHPTNSPVSTPYTHYRYMKIKCGHKSYKFEFDRFAGKPVPITFAKYAVLLTDIVRWTNCNNINLDINLY